MEWTRHDVSSWPVAHFEALGHHGGTWLLEQGPDRTWLHKATAIPESTGVEQGEDWSEVVSTAIGVELGIPCAETRLCVRDGRRGSLSRNVAESGQDLVVGTLWMEDVAPETEGGSGRPPGPEPEPMKREGHSLDRISRALESVAAPPTFAGPRATPAFDVFAGYLLLDALIANQDRHSENWAVLVPSTKGGVTLLAPSFDHASSLGFNLSDVQRANVIARGIGTWAKRGRATRFEHTSRPPTLVEHAARAISMCTQTGRDWWTMKLASADFTELFDTVESHDVDGMSDSAVTFARYLVDENLRRIRHASRELA